MEADKEETQKPPLQEWVISKLPRSWDDYNVIETTEGPFKDEAEMQQIWEKALKYGEQLGESDYKVTFALKKGAEQFDIEVTRITTNMGDASGRPIERYTFDLHPFSGTILTPQAIPIDVADATAEGKRSTPVVNSDSNNIPPWERSKPETKEPLRDPAPWER
jgi:hypothetical protein